MNTATPIPSFATGFAPRDGPPKYPDLYDGLAVSYRMYHGQSHLLQPNWSRYGAAYNGTHVNWQVGVSTRYGYADYFPDLAANSPYINCGLLPNLPATGRPNLSVAVMMRQLVNQASAGFFDNSQGGGPNTTRLFIGRQATALKVITGDGALQTLFTSNANAVVLNVWSAIVVTFNCNNEICYYKNGQPWGTSVMDRDIAVSAATWKIGWAYNLHTKGGDEHIAYLHAWHRTITQKEALFLAEHPYALDELAD